ncbi:integrase [Antarctobacter heliothermus]|uniref:Integrase n=1 Tax=Antarctobacter heliothermus TaxID=74033 RepID=A0A222E600_9RHOB|nr:hypothetical protein [Antarctobacter heliothermus]ASP21625.1 integrase [Antarctobacter heliothermus]
MTRTNCIHHARCADGVTAAWAERTVWRALMSYAKAEHWRTDNIARDAEIRRSNSKPHEPWTAMDVVAFRARWPLGPAERQAFAVIFWTAARCIDAAWIGWQCARDGILSFEQEKTGGNACVPVAEPIHPFLRADPRHSSTPRDWSSCSLEVGQSAVNQGAVDADQLRGTGCRADRKDGARATQGTHCDPGSGRLAPTPDRRLDGARVTSRGRPRHPIREQTGNGFWKPERELRW